MSATGLFAEFDAVTDDEWLAATEKSLRGRPVETLVKKTYEGLEIHPLTSADDLVDTAHVDTLPGQFPFVRGARAAGYRAHPWLIAQEIDIADSTKFNHSLKHALVNGQTAIFLGTKNCFDSRDDISAAFADVELESLPLLLAGEERAITTYRLLKEYLGDDKIVDLRGCLGFDPLHGLAENGVLNEDFFAQMPEYIADELDLFPALSFIAVRDDIYHEAGANAVQTLALVAATATEYLRMIIDHGLAVDFAARQPHFFLSIGENFFMEVAKLRAIKVIWAQIVRAFGGAKRAQGISLHARTGSRNKTRLDPHVNMLRTTSEALAAAIGGVDSLTLAPFDAPLGTSDDFSRRVARNVQLILQQELQLTNLIDPVGGSWHVEKLTDQLARAAWQLFQEIEARGGLQTCLQTGFIQREIEAVAQQRLRDLESQEAVLVGTNMYADANETLSFMQEQPQSRRHDNAIRTRSAAIPLKPLRLAEPFETLPGPSGVDA